MSKKIWRCFHCDEVFTSRVKAADHFGDGDYENETPLCVEAQQADIQKLILTNREMWEEVQSLNSQLEEAEDHIANWEEIARKVTKKPDATAHDVWCEFDSLEGRVIAAESDSASLSLASPQH